MDPGWLNWLIGLFIPVNLPRIVTLTDEMIQACYLDWCIDPDVLSWLMDWPRFVHQFGELIDVLVQKSCLDWWTDLEWMSWLLNSLMDWFRMDVLTSELTNGLIHIWCLDWWTGWWTDSWWLVNCFRMNVLFYTPFSISVHMLCHFWFLKPTLHVYMISLSFSVVFVPSI